jgi:hypothetical protein
VWRECTTVSSRRPGCGPSSEGPWWVGASVGGAPLHGPILVVTARASGEPGGQSTVLLLCGVAPNHSSECPVGPRWEGAAVRRGLLACVYASEGLAPTTLASVLPAWGGKGRPSTVVPR